MRTMSLPVVYSGLSSVHLALRRNGKEESSSRIGDIFGFIMKTLIQAFFLCVVYHANATSYVFMNRSGSAFETPDELKVKFNYIDVASMKPGQWKLLVIEGNETNALFNAVLERKSVTTGACDFNPYPMTLSHNSIEFVSISEEYCTIMPQTKGRAYKVLERAVISEGIRYHNRRVTRIPKEELETLTEKLIGDVTKEVYESLNLSYDSLMALALEALKLRKQLAEKEEAMKNQLLEYFELMKAINQLDQNVQPIVDMGMEEGGLNKEGKMTYNIRATFSYDIAEEGVKAELIHYPPGAYLLKQSAAASATAFSMKKSIENYLSDYFEPGSIVKIRIIGSADSSPISTPIAYQGEYGNIQTEPYELVDDYQIILTEDPEIDSSWIDSHKGASLMKEIAAKKQEIVHGSPLEFNLKGGEQFQKNESLAYLRSLGIRDYIVQNVVSLKNTRNEFLHQVKLEEGVGGIYRKVVMELLIEDVMRLK